MSTTTTNNQPSFPSPLSAHPPVSQRNLLFHLPIEIRQMIYAYAYPSTTRIRHTALAPQRTNVLRWLPIICSTDRATYVDAGFWYISTTCFSIPLPSAQESLHNFSGFLDLFPGSSGFDALNRLKIEYFDVQLRGFFERAQRTALWDFLGSCARLRELTLQFRAMNLLDIDVSCLDAVMSNVSQQEQDIMPYLRPLEDVIKSCEVDKLFEVDLRGLRTVYLEVWPTMLVEEAGTSAVSLTAMPLVEELVGYLRDGFGARGRDVEVAIRDVPHRGGGGGTIALENLYDRLS